MNTINKDLAAAVQWLLQILWLPVITVVAHSFLNNFSQFSNVLNTSRLWCPKSSHHKGIQVDDIKKGK